MPKELRFDGKVAIVTGAGNGLGRSHALLLASRGAKVLINDLGGSAHGEGKSSAAADQVVQDIKAAGGEAAANYDSVEDGGKIVQAALDHFGRVDIVVNNAGILRDTTFHKMTEQDWELIYRVHVLGSFRVTHAAWPRMRDQGYGRVIMTASAAGIYGNFGQANYSMAKLGLLGLSNTLALEGKKRGVHVNTIAPLAGSRLTETVLPQELVDALKPEFVSPLLAYLCHESCEETGGLFEVGGGFVAKLRWERARGHTFRLGRAITPEALAASWSRVTSFGETTHPSDVTSAMAPVMENIQAGPSKGGNDIIDVDQALGYEFPPMTSSYDERDVALYALGVGAAGDPLDDGELKLVYEMHGAFQTLPTYGVIPCMNAMLTMAKEGKQAPGMNYGFDRLLHGEQRTEIIRPLPPKAKLTHKVRIKDIFDKGKNAIIVSEVRSFDESGEELIKNEFTAVIRGAGGWGGDRGPSAEINVPPSRAPDQVITEKIGDSQALLYRLSGDWNPLHVDPSFATAFGFKRPILHGLCTFGYAGRHVVKAFAGGDPRLFKSIKVRFADSVFPGETLVTEMWKESDTKIVFVCKVKERDKVVISNAAVELYREVPKPKAKAAPAPAPTASAPSPDASAGFEPRASDVFVAIRDHVERSPELVAKVQNVFLFKITEPASEWTLDLKNGKGSVSEGAGKADVTLELSESDLLAMTSGQADPQKLYFAGKLKISGNVMASQKLEFLKKMDPERAKAAVLAARGASPSASGSAPKPAATKPAAPAPAKPASNRAAAPAIFDRLKERIEKAPELVREVQAVVAFKITSPDAEWVVDLATGKGSVRVGGAKDAAATITMSDEDFELLCRGSESAQTLHQAGRMRVDGDVRVAHRLGFLKQLA